jgi:hypothetical protein
MTESLAQHAGDLAPLLLPNFSIRHQLDGGEMVVKLSGNADSEVGAAFAIYLEQMHERAVRAGVSKVVLDFRELYFLTSSCIKCLVVAIKRVAAMDAPSRYSIELLTTPSLRWQERSFEVLCKISPLVTMTAD